jgi:hypothetical protein
VDAAISHYNNYVSPKVHLYLGNWMVKRVRWSALPLCHIWYSFSWFSFCNNIRTKTPSYWLIKL